jgi:predicted  nucleic acid-binding Zn-ribbon protein
MFLIIELPIASASVTAKMTNSTSNDNQEIRALLAELAQRQLNTENSIQETQEQIQETQEQLRELSSEVTRVLARSAILDDVLLEFRDSHELMQRNFNEHQRTTNAALQSLEAILLQLIRMLGRE